MSYTYLQGQEVAYSEDICSAIDACVQSKSKSTPEKSSYKDNLTGSYQNSQSGTISRPLMDDHGKEWWTLFAEDSHAKTSHVPEKVQESKEKDLGCGVRCRGSLMKYDLNTHSWKTAQCSLLEGLDVFLGTWPKWGIMLGGECWELINVVGNMKEKDYGYLPTPTKGDVHIQLKKASSMKKYVNGGRQIQLFKLLQMNFVEPYQIIPIYQDLMGWPIHWTRLQPLETDKFQEWLNLHGEY